MSNSASSEITAYCRTRLLRWRVLVLWLLLLAALVAANPSLSVDQGVTGAVFLALALAVLRLWDDLADLPHDQVHHSERILVRSTHLGVFRAVVWMGTVLLALSLWPDLQRLAMYGGLLAALAWFYHGPWRARVARLPRACLVLAKYPVLVVLAGAEPSKRTWLIGLILYALLAAHEWQDTSA